MGVDADRKLTRWVRFRSAPTIQARHYDRHDYMPEKRAALALWVQRLKGIVQVVPVKRKTKRSRPGVAV